MEINNKEIRDKVIEKVKNGDMFRYANNIGLLWQVILISIIIFLMSIAFFAPIILESYFLSKIDTTNPISRDVTVTEINYKYKNRKEIKDSYIGKTKDGQETVFYSDEDLEVGDSQIIWNTKNENRPWNTDKEKITDKSVKIDFEQLGIIILLVLVDLWRIKKLIDTNRVEIIK